MTSISAHDAAAASHVENAPADPVASRDHEEAADSGNGTTTKETSAEDEQAAARRDVFLLAGIRKLIKSFRSLSHIFEVYKDGDDDEEADSGMDIQIGFPTDVQHVAHIGLDGSSNVAGLRGMEGARDVFSLSTNLSLQQFEFAMSSLAAHDDPNAALARN